MSCSVSYITKGYFFPYFPESASRRAAGDAPSSRRKSAFISFDRYAPSTALILENALGPSTKPPALFCVSADPTTAFADLPETLAAGRFEVVEPERVSLILAILKVYHNQR